MVQASSSLFPPSKEQNRDLHVTMITNENLSHDFPITFFFFMTAMKDKSNFHYHQS